jgi:hypothetical protein
MAEDLLNAGADGLRRLVDTAAGEKFVLVVDQFEEVFTLCADEGQRQRFFQCLLQGLERCPKLCVIVAMRADFFGKCVEQRYGGLAERMQPLMTVTPMEPQELREAIAKPALQVNLAIEPQLIEQMMTDVQGAPGSLPLLQYTLTELWKQRTETGIKLAQYSQLGGIGGTLQKRATAVYESFAEEERSTVQHVFLSLTQLGEGTEDTRRRVVLADLVSGQHSEAIVNRVVQKLADEKLIVTSEMVAKGSESKRIAVVDVAHEALIRHWELLRSWLEVRRDRLRQVRKLEERAIEWRNGGWKPEDLLQGRAIRNALRFRRKEQAEGYSLTKSVEDLIKRSAQHRRANRLMFLFFSCLMGPLVLVPFSIIWLWLDSFNRTAHDLKISENMKIVTEEANKQDRYSPKGIKALQFLAQKGQSLKEIPLKNANFIGANLRSAYLSSVDLSGIDLRNANLRNAYLIGANLRDSDFRSAKLSFAKLSFAKLFNANLFNADLSFAELIDANLIGSDLSFANLSSADLSSADLSSANLSSADLSFADLSSAILLTTDFRDTKGIIQRHLEGENPPLLCNVALPPGISVNPDRDCDRLPQVLLERYPNGFKTFEAAKDFVNEARRRKWD